MGIVCVKNKVGVQDGEIDNSRYAVHIFLSLKLEILGLVETIIQILSEKNSLRMRLSFRLLVLFFMSYKIYHMIDQQQHDAF